MPLLKNDAQFFFFLKENHQPKKKEANHPSLLKYKKHAQFKRKGSGMCITPRKKKRRR